MNNYGTQLAEKIKTGHVDSSGFNDFEQFVLSSGHYYDTEEDLKAGYDRRWKVRHGLWVTAEEFTAEVRSRVKHNKELDVWPLYEILSRLVKEEKLSHGEAFKYAAYAWCLRKPETVVAYQSNDGKWIVNNCDTEIPEEQARITICENLGFEASRVRIVGTPYYDATDWQFIRFDCAGRTYLYKNDTLYQVYDE